MRSEAFRRICGAEDVLRELAFITSLPAAEVMAAQGRALPDGPAADAGVLVQGIADIVLVYPRASGLQDGPPQDSCRLRPRLPRSAGALRQGH